MLRSIGRKPLELLSILATEDLTLYQAAEKMHISIKTANVHIAKIKRVLGCHTIYMAVALGIKSGIVEWAGVDIQKGVIIKSQPFPEGVLVRKYRINISEADEYVYS